MLTTEKRKISQIRERRVVTYKSKTGVHIKEEDFANKIKIGGYKKEEEFVRRVVTYKQNRQDVPVDRSGLGIATIAVKRLQKC